METTPFSSLFSAKHLSRDEVDGLYQRALKRIEMGIFGHRLDLITEIKPETLNAYNELNEQLRAIELDYQTWKSSFD